MSTIALSKTGYRSVEESNKNVSLMERIKNYFTENSTIIITGLMMMNGSRDMYSTYEMLKRQERKIG